MENMHLFSNKHCKVVLQEAVSTVKAYAQKHYFFFLRTRFCRIAQSVFIVETTTVKKISKPVIFYFSFVYSVEGSGCNFF